MFLPFIGVVATQSFTPPTPIELNPDVFTKLLLHMDGADESTTFTDSALGGNAPHTVTANGDAQLDTAQYRYSTASGLLDGTGDYLTVPANTDFNFGAGDCTIEFWVYIATADAFSTGGADIRRVVTIGELESENGSLTLGVGRYASGSYAGRRIVFSIRSGGSVYDYASTDIGSTFSYDEWHHVAFVQDSTTVSMYFDGVSYGFGLGSNPMSYNIGLDTGQLQIGGRYNGSSWTEFFKGHLDELRISNIARY